MRLVAVGSDQRALRWEERHDPTWHEWLGSESVVRRWPVGAGDAELAYGDIRLLASNNVAQVGGRDVPLSERQWQVLAMLVRAAGARVSTGSLAAAVLGTDDRAARHNVRVLVYRLRERIGPAHLPYTPRSGYPGYRLVAPEAAP